MIKRSRIYYFYITIIYFVLAFTDLKGNIFMTNIEDYIYRYIFQQVFIVFTCMVIGHILMNEGFLRLYEDFFQLYLKNSKKYFYSTLLLLWAVNIVPFIVGQILSFIVNYLHTGILPFTLFMANIVIVSIEIMTAISFLMFFSLIIRKNVLVYSLYIMFIFTLLVANNIYISIPLTMGIIEKHEYYVTFAHPLWIGRIILLIISVILLRFSIGRLRNKKI